MSKINFTRLLTIFVLSISLLLGGCGSDITPPAHAATTAGAPGVCDATNSFPEQFAHGTVQPDRATIFETPDYLQFASPVCQSSGLILKSSYTLQFNHQVQLIDMQMGSGMSNSLHDGQPKSNVVGEGPELFEWVWWAQFDTPDGRHYEFFQQYDKHSDVRGNQNDKIGLPHGLTLPSGTVVTIFRPPSAALDSATEIHPTGQKIELVGY